jgi:uncharacterized repeat protein (TIGR03803 family)
VNAHYDIRFEETKMKSSILITLRAALIAATCHYGLMTSRAAQSRKENNVRRLSLSKIACIVSVFCAATAILSPAQTTFTSLLSFNGNNGTSPHYVNLVQGVDGNLYGTSYASTGSGGTIFKVTTTGTLTTLYTFCPNGESCEYGAQPSAGLVLGTDGNFYGTTMNGGANSDGAVFKITPAGALTTLHSFDQTDGAQPQSALIQASNGNFYGTTAGGGTGDVGTIFQITSAGAFSSLHSFDGTDGDYAYSSLVQGTSGNLYGVTKEGGTGFGTVYEMTTAGQFSTLSTFDSAEGSGNYGKLLQASNGNFYGTSIGGGNGMGTIYEVTPAGRITVLYSFCAKSGCPDGAIPYAGLIRGSDGNLYGTTFAGGITNANCSAGCGTVYEITTAGKFTTLYSFCSQASCADGSAPMGGLVQDTNGTFYGTTYYGGTVGVGTIYSLSTALTPFVQTTPTTAPVGTTIIIIGNNLTGTTQVSFNGIAANFTVISSTEIQATVPAGATSGVVTVVTPSGTLKTIVTFYVVVTPQIKSFTPKSGPVGTTVTITGVGLTLTSEVTFDGVAATDFTVDSDKKVTATVPTGAKTGKIAITTPGGTATSTTSFTVTE